MNFVSFQCEQTQHSFVRYGEDEVRALHSDNTLCESAEFNLIELLEDDLPRLFECPWCLIKTLDIEHVRRCSNYKPAYSEDEIRDAYSHPADQAKRDSLLRDFE
jgi:hypothetical protein